MIPHDDFKKLDIRIADVLEAREHPHADKLLILSIAIGEERRQIVAGLKKDYAPDQLVGKKIVVLANLEPAMLRGVESQGMLLAASGDQGVALLVPEKDVRSGAVVR